MSIATLDYHAVLARLTAIQELVMKPQRHDAEHDDWFEYDPDAGCDKLRADRTDNPRWIDLKFAADELAAGSGIQILSIPIEAIHTFMPSRFHTYRIPVTLHRPDGQNRTVGFKDELLMSYNELRGVCMHIDEWIRHLKSADNIRNQLKGKHRLLFDCLYQRIGKRVEVYAVEVECWPDEHPSRQRVRATISELRKAVDPVYDISPITDARDRGGYITMTKS